LWFSAGDVLEVVRGGEGKAAGVGREKGGDGSCVGIGICGVGAGKGLADLVLFLQVCRLILTGTRRSAAFVLFVIIAGGVGKELGCFGDEKGFGFFGIGSFSIEQKASMRPSKQAAKAWSSVGTSSV